MGAGGPHEQDVGWQREDSSVPCFCLGWLCVFSGKNQRTLLEGLGPGHVTLRKLCNLFLDQFPLISLPHTLHINKRNDNKECFGSVIYKNTESLCYILETNIILSIGYITIKKLKKECFEKSKNNHHHNKNNNKPIHS